MDYELKKFQREKTSIVPIEEVYTDLDIKENDPYEPSIGYRFDTPRRWAQDKSKSKSVGIRDLKLTPSSGDIRCRFVHLLYPCVDAFTATWNATNGEYDIDYDTITHHTVWAPRTYMTNDIIENITPANGFEEIITDILFNKLNGNIWREIRKATKATNYFYMSYAQSSTQTRSLYYKASDGTQADVSNKKALPIPSTFSYNYDSNTCQLSINTVSHLRTIDMTNSTTLSSVDENGAVTISTVGYNPHDTVDAATSEISGCNHAYVQNPSPVNSELLMITDDQSSLKNIYALFNQRFPQKLIAGTNKYEDDFDSVASILIDGKLYYVPFIHNDGSSLITIQGAPYTSYFCLSNKAAGRTADTSYVTDINNLNLNNVWDRIHLIYHTTFAETRTRMIGRNNDHWDSPNKRFMVPGSDQDQFYLRFTTDGKHNILPVGCHFNVDLCFMLNSTNNTATGTGNHDLFK